MGLTQVMLQVKGCEMVCKQRESIPRLSRLSPPNSCLLLPFSPFFPPQPACQTVSDSTQRGLSEAIKKVPKHRRKCHWLANMRRIRINTGDLSIG